MDLSNEVYEELSEFEKFKADKLIKQAFKNAHNYRGEVPAEHDRLIIRDYIRNNLSILNRSKSH